MELCLSLLANHKLPERPNVVIKIPRVHRVPTFFFSFYLFNMEKVVSLSYLKKKSQRQRGCEVSWRPDSMLTTANVWFMASQS